MSPDPSTWLVIPVHNRREITRACLLRLHQQQVGKWARILVVDDGSTDGTREMLASQFPGVTVLHGSGHLWWTGAIVLGMSHAIQHGADTIVWLNDDCLPDPGAVETLVRTARETGGLCGAVCRGTDGSAVAYAGGAMKKTWPVPLRTLPPDPAAQIDVDWLHGNLVAIPERVWRLLGLPRADKMPHNLADIAYTYEARRVGIPVCLVPAATALASANDSASYWSWADSRLSWGDLLRGFWNPKVWWYLPGVSWFQISLFGVRGVVALSWLLVKLGLLLPLKLLVPARILQGRQKAAAGL